MSILIPPFNKQVMTCRIWGPRMFILYAIDICCPNPRHVPNANKWAGAIALLKYKRWTSSKDWFSFPGGIRFPIHSSERRAHISMTYCIITIFDFCYIEITTEDSKCVCLQIRYIVHYRLHSFLRKICNPTIQNQYISSAMR